jgi:hypothetical protein
MAPITVTSSPREGCATAPTLLMRSSTASISASVAVDFITIIMVFRLPVLVFKEGTGLEHAWT